ncbi:hypothetical protein ACEQ6A_36515, partial [Rhizobium brockwellii]
EIAGIGLNVPSRAVLQTCARIVTVVGPDPKLEDEAADRFVIVRRIWLMGEYARRTKEDKPCPDASARIADGLRRLR